MEIRHLKLNRFTNALLKVAFYDFHIIMVDCEHDRLSTLSNMTKAPGHCLKRVITILKDLEKLRRVRTHTCFVNKLANGESFVIILFRFQF